jgi:hypothetical protein
MTPIRFEKRYDMTNHPDDWSLVRIALDWFSQPLLLFVEGKPRQPDFHTDPDAWSRWCRIPPKAHHLIYWEDGRERLLTFEHSQGLLTAHIQRFEDGWLLGECRNGLTRLYDHQGRIRSELNLGDASEDIQTTPDGQIWVSYFDEGVFGNGIGAQGVVCFDGKAAPIFQYATFAEQNGLPSIDDCYSMNVASGGDVWLNYYSDFPLVRVRNFVLDRVWKSFGALGSAFAVGGDRVLYFQGAQILAVNLESFSQPEKLAVLDADGRTLVPLANSGLGVAARFSKLLINTGAGLYESANEPVLP